MAWLGSTLVLILLLVQPGWAQPKFRMEKSEVRVVEPGKTVDLKCEILGTSQTGLSWVHQRPVKPNQNAMAPTFLVFFSGTVKTIRKAEGLDRSLEAKRLSSASFQVTLKDFQEKDEGHYYCVVAYNQALYFSRSMSVFLKGPATTRPPVPRTTTARPDPLNVTRTTPALSNCQDRPSSKKSLNQRWFWDFSCDLYIWGPLAGGCVVLLIALLTTIIICKKSRRRVCRCARPLSRPPRKPGVPG
ncbi:T-cell surface glycoprotein CD8 alpha chain [Tachyglossus aculeatus]|uniref:T-cell surface glycoprotein CD8 alpha chain n=1 Tax=Tachyglossus aculeatus TaxID=9261 RepID=UPI0018F63839|nr:T-cell surface glycoprotein CD8 alpha chain [Tachyglossus aculeatus]